MILTHRLIRYCYAPNATLGRWFAPNWCKPFFTVEREWTSNHVNISCIPEGYYRAERYHSPKHDRDTFLIDVIGRTGIEIDIANLARQLRGCIGLGTQPYTDTLGVAESEDAYNFFMSLMAGIDEFNLHVTQYRPTFNHSEQF